MKRNKFIAAILTFAAVPLTNFADSFKKFSRINKGFKVAAGEGQIHGHIKLKGVNANIMEVKISGKDTDGAIAIFEQTSMSPGRGTPYHLHPTQDEIFYVLEGSYFFKIGDDKFHLSIGDSIFLPRNVLHAWTQVSDRGKMTVTFQPAGKLEEFFLAMQALDHEPTGPEVAKIFADHEMQIVGPPLKIE